MKENLQKFVVNLGLIFVVIYGALLLSWKFGNTEAMTMQWATLFIIVYCFFAVFFSFSKKDLP